MTLSAQTRYGLGNAKTVALRRDMATMESVAIRVRLFVRIRVLSTIYVALRGVSPNKRRYVDA